MKCRSSRSLSDQYDLRVLTFLGISLLFFSGCSVTVFDEKRPVVRYRQIKGELEVVAENRKDEQEIGDTRRTNESIESQEKLKLETEGDIYHPDLLTYSAALALGLRQDRFDFDGNIDEGSGTIDEYSVSGQLLPKKPYPMGFYVDKSEQYIPRLFSSTLKSERESAGGSLHLDSKDWPMNFQYGESQTRQRGLNSRDLDFYVRENKSFRYSLEHDFSELSNLNFDYESDDVWQDRFGTIFFRKENRYNLRHDLLFGDDGQHQFGSYFNFLDQSGDYQLEQLRWQERLRLQHSDTLETNYSFAYDESQRPTLDNNMAQVNAGFVHRLFQSLVTKGNIFTSDADLGDGVNVKREGGRLGFDYQKRNPWGTFFGNYSIGLINLKQTGGHTLVNVIDERHPFEITGSLRIQLERTNINTSSITVMDSGRSKFYSDYTITQNNGITELIIIPGGDITTDGDQTLSIDYDFFTEPQRDEDSTTESLTVRERFHNGLSLYYQHHTRDERINSTDTDLIPDEFEINTFGTDYINKGLRLLAEYSRDKSTRIPSRSKRLEASYLWYLNLNTKISVYASNSWINYLGTVPYDITLLTLGASASSKLTKNYSIYGNVDYRDEDDSRQGLTKGFQCAMELRYILRQLSVSTGVEFNSLDRLSHETDNSLLYFRMKRTF